MSVIQNNDDEHMTTVDFSNMYNKWLEELVLIEKNLMLKANEVQKLQCNLNQETETVIFFIIIISIFHLIYYNFSLFQFIFYIFSVKKTK